MTPSFARDTVSRRDVLKGLAAGVAASVVPPGLTMATEEGKARVVRVECGRLWSNDRRDPEAISEMIERGLVALTGKASGGEAWTSLLGPRRRIGLKINLLGRPRVYTAPEIAEQVTASLIRAGIEGPDIVVWDRPENHFGKTVYKLGRGRFGESVEGGGRYSFSYKEPRSFVATSTCGLLPVDLIPLTRTEATVSLPVIKDHSLSGVTGALKNIAFGCFHTIPQCHDNNCDPFIAEACEHFLKVNPVPLIVLDATEGCFDGGPVPERPSVIWRESALYFATDPVALDRVAGAVIARKREAAGLGDITAMTRHIDTAAAKKLGQGDPAKIEEIVIRL